MTFNVAAVIIHWVLVITIVEHIWRDHLRFLPTSYMLRRLLSSRIHISCGAFISSVPPMLSLARSSELVQTSLAHLPFHGSCALSFGRFRWSLHALYSFSPWVRFLGVWLFSLTSLCFFMCMVYCSVLCLVSWAKSSELTLTYFLRLLIFQGHAV